MTGAQRNDPCPCGSGRKYKACCLERDRAADRTLQLLGAGAADGDAPWGPAARGAAFWEADVVPLPIGIREDRDATPALVMVAAGGFIVHGEVVPRRPIGPANRARALARAVSQAGRELGLLPEALHVRDEAVARELAEELRPRGISVRAAPLPGLDEAAESSITHLTGGPVAAHVVRLESWAETEALPAEIGALHAAAAAFHRAEPWCELENGDVLELRFPGGEAFVASVMGAGGEQFGLNLYSAPEDLAALLEGEGAADVAETVATMVGWELVVDFEPRAELTRRMRREVAGAGWEVDGPDAFPCLWGIHLPGHRLTAAHVRLMTAALQAVTLKVADERGESRPSAGAGVEVEIHYERPASPFPRLAAAHPIVAEGRNADPGAALELFDADLDAVLSAEAERVERFERWLEAQPLTKAARRRHLRNARELAACLALEMVTTPACTEFDLRHYLYLWLPRHVRLPRDVGRAIPQSLRTWFDWLSAHEEIACPWAAGVLDEIPEVLDRAGLDPDGAWWDEPEAEWPGAFWIDADLRGFVPDHDLPGTGGWPVMMSGDVAVARETLNRLWLLWYDELVRAGLTEVDLLWEALARRQHAWEKQPLAALGGRTPRDLVRDQERLADDDGEGDDGADRDEAAPYDLFFGEADRGTSRDG